LYSLYQKRLGYRAGQFPNAEKHFEQAISLPLFPDISEEEIERVTGALREISCTYAK
jgi:dTDP-4-amino-4,6-dideoxygalactose transaminase